MAVDDTVALFTLLSPKPNFRALAIFVNPVDIDARAQLSRSLSQYCYFNRL